MKKFISLFCVTVLLLLALSPQLTFAEEPTNAQSASSFIVSSEAPLYDAIDKKELGILSTDSTIYYAKVENGDVYIQWGDHLAYLSVDKVNFDESQKASSQIDKSNPIGDIEVLKDTYVYSLDGKKLVAVKAGMEYPYESIDAKGNYQVIIGDQLSYFSKDDVKIVQKDSSGEKTADDNGQVGTGKQSQSTTNQTNASTSSSTKSSTKDAKVIKPQQDSATAKVTFGDYFKVSDANVPVYTNQRGNKLVQIGSLQQGQVYKRVGDSTNWHEIQFEGGSGYVKKSQTVPDDDKSIDNLNTNYKNTTTKVKALKPTIVYDNVSGKLVPFATIQKGEQYPIVTGTFTSWYRIVVAGRVGYINKSNVQASGSGFTPQDKFFKVSEDKVPVYTNQRGTKLVQIGSLEKGQAYERVGDSTSWHEIQFEGGSGYVKKSQTVPDDGKSIHNLNTSYKNTTTKFEVLKTTVVYDNTSGKLVPFATIQKGEQYPVVTGIFTSWYRIVVAGRVGYVHKVDVKLIPKKSTSFTSTKYNTTLDGMVDKEMGRSPQTDQVLGYLREDAFGKITGSTGIVSGSDWQVRGGPSTSEEVVGTLQNGHQVDILGETKVGSFSWYEVEYVVPFGNAFENEVDYFVDPANFSRGTSDYYQFLRLSGSANIDADEVNQKILAGKGILAGEAQAFVSAAKQFNVNEIYLMSHALLETGNGASKLATGGFVVQGKKVYNMYGIDATDSCPQCGAQYAYDHEWFTPEQAIIGGAQFIDRNYILAGQDTLYKMRWNPDINNLGHQYATDIGWAVKQTTSISNLYSLLNTYNQVFDVPVYKAAG